MDNNLINKFPSVIVLMPAYNHEMYIAQAIESVLNQITSFVVHLNISDDASTDSTFSIASTYSNKNKVVIKLTRKENNIGAMLNGAWLRNESLNSDCKYSAILEGDDYWTDPFKLQKQVDFLEANSDFVICYHPVNVLFPDGKVEEDYLLKGLIQKSESTIYDLAVLGNYIHTPSVVFRNVVNDYPKSILDSPIGDFFLWMLLAQYGKIKKLPDVMAVYRLGVGVHSTQGEKSRQSAFLKTLILLSETMEDKSIVEILKNRIAAIKSVALPYPVRGLDDFGDLVKAENLKDYVSFGQLLKTIWLKILRKF